MPQILVIDDDHLTASTMQVCLRLAGYDVTLTTSGAQALDALKARRFDAIVSDLRMPELSGLDVLRLLRDQGRSDPFVFITGFATIGDAAAAMRLGASDFLEKPVFEEELLQSISRALMTTDSSPNRGTSDACVEAHAAARWARTVVAVIECPRDPRTIGGWARWVAVSPGALRNWCRTAGIAPRRSLSFARMMRAALLAERGGHRPENLLDVVDHRTLVAMMKSAGFENEHVFPTTLRDYLDRQTIVHDASALAEVRKVLGTRMTASSPQR